MKQLFIWWHRRRAQWHTAIKHVEHSYFYKTYNYHASWSQWHQHQIERLEENQ